MAKDLRPLEDELRKGEATGDLILLLRGGEDTRAKFLRQADLLEEVFTYGGEPARGVSLFAALGDLDARLVLGAKLANYRRYYRLDGPTVAALALLLPTFRAPHWTLLFQTPPGGQRQSEDEILDRLLDILGPALDNPKYEPRHGHRR
jgi:hypothetical protein